MSVLLAEPDDYLDAMFAVLEYRHRQRQLRSEHGDGAMDFLE